MYPPSMHDCFQWELENYPWWLDMEKGHVLLREKNLYKERASLHVFDKEKSNLQRW